MPGHTCVMCGSTPTQDPDASFHCLPSNPARRASWLDAFGLEERQLKAQSRVCCCFLQLVGTFRPLQSNHHFNVGTAWDSNGLLRVAPAISVAVKVTETGHKELLHLGSWSPIDIADITCVLALSSR